MSCVLNDFNEHEYIEQFVGLLQQHSVKVIPVRAGGAGEGAAAPQLRKLCNFSGKTLLIRAMTFGRKHYKIMPLT